MLPMKKSKIFSKLLNLFAVIILLITSFYAGYKLRDNGFLISSNQNKLSINREAPDIYKDVDMSLFWNIWDEVSAKYWHDEKLNSGKMVYGAISGMVAAIGDPYTVFLPPEENKVVAEDIQGNFEGVGIQIGYRGTQLAVVSPLPGSPAEKAGVRAGDFIIGIKDEKQGVEVNTSGISLPQAVQYIRGPKGSIVTLALLREGKDDPILVDVTRDTIDVPSVDLSFVGDIQNIAHLRLLKFGGETQAEWDNAVLEILKNPALDGIILDLRGNPGGYLQGAVDVGAEFLPTGTLVVSEEQKGIAPYEYKTTRIGKLKNQNLVVLVDGGSASASEILAGALRDEIKTTIIGTKTFGKGTIQERIELDDQSALHLTIARWITPSGFWVNEVGLTPDIEVSDDPNTFDKDEQLQKAIEIILAKN